MTIRYTHTGTHYTIPKGDVLAEYAVSAYAFVINTSEHRNREYNGRGFAAAIREVFDATEPRNALVVAHLEAI